MTEPSMQNPTDRNSPPFPDSSSISAKNNRWRTPFGLAVTMTYLIASAAYVYLNWSEFAALNPNEIGDFFAGVFAPLAFLWLVLGFLQQGDELRNSVDALLLQGRELNSSVAQQRELVAVTREQLALETLRADRAEAESSRLAQPIVNIACAVYMTSGADLYHNIDIGNAGETCSNLVITFDGVFPEFRRPTFKSGATDRFTAAVNSAELREAPVQISYVDRLSKPQSQSGKLVPYKHGNGLTFIEGD